MKVTLVNIYRSRTSKEEASAAHAVMRDTGPPSVMIWPLRFIPYHQMEATIGDFQCRRH